MTKSLYSRRDEAYQAAKSLHSQFDEAPTTEQLTELKSALDVVEELDDQIAAVRAKNSSEARLRGLFQEGHPEESGNLKAASLGEHFVKHAGEVLVKQGSGVQMDHSTPEFSVKAANDPLTTPANLVEGWGTTYNRTIVNQRREELITQDLMGTANVTTSTVKYIVEKLNRIREGAAAAVAEGALKPYIRYDNFDVITDSLAKVAALTKLSDEMIEDFSFVTDWINGQLLYDLSLTEEQQLLNGNGAGSNLTGLLNRSGIQTHKAASANIFDELFIAQAKVRQATPLSADAYVINELDYQPLRLAKDANGQYVAGGPFMGQYGVGGILVQPPLWAKKTVVTNLVPQGTALAGAFKQGAIVLRKGGVRVDSTNTNDRDFEHNLVTLRAEERLGLMVPLPAAFVKIDLTGGA
ncbi:phage major capsid protein [Corynebacterium doosanense]|uniref:Capsid protein n=1 Tax=Corynebacterium doosanense CAU 212 = DSM 45436 TaxID=558173 RepID=A0A097IDG0_9CORY|nr:phage major capsid protein [Corynebacterium doosanense]AIT60162.1 capsid protein [Corynebacterium doosanense CAU 212 = DSM 45436]